MITLILLITLAIIFSFILGAAESAFFSLKSWEIKELTKKNINGNFNKLINDNQNLVSTLSLGTTTFHSFIIAVFVQSWINLNIMYFMLFLCILILFIALLCEILPKTLAINSPKKWALTLSKPVLLFDRISKPIRYMAQKISDISLNLILPKKLLPNITTTEEEFSELIDWAYQQGVLEKSERDIVDEIIKLDKKTAEDIMKPRSHMICIEDNISTKEMILASRKHKLTRIPIFNDTTDNIVGILNTRKLLLNPSQDLSESIEFPSFVPSTMNLMDLLKSLQAQRRGLAIVLDEFGGTAGLITIEDILEELLGEMREEGEKIEFTIEKLNRNRWRVNGALSIDDFKKTVPELNRIAEVDTMGGLILALKEFVPQVGESIQYKGFNFTVVAADERRVKELVVKKISR